MNKVMEAFFSALEASVKYYFEITFELVSVQVARRCIYAVLHMEGRAIYKLYLK